MVSCFKLSAVHGHLHSSIQGRGRMCIRAGSGGGPLARRVQRWQTGGVETPALERTGRRALNRMVQANLRLVVSIARRYHCAPVERMDLIQAGHLGLIRAGEQFDPPRGYPFPPSAFWWTR